MFTSDNYSFDGYEYDYDALNKILREKLNGSTNPHDIKNASDAINDALVFDGEKIMFCNIQVGIISENA